MKQFNKYEDAQTICSEIYDYCSPDFRAGFSIRISGGSYHELISHSDWRGGKGRGWDAAEKMINEGLIFYVQPMECERDKSCPIRFQYGGFWACNSCNTHIDTPEWWKIKVMKDGDAFCCIGDGFTNLQESNNYAFGATEKEAIENYRLQIYKSKAA